MNLLRSEVLKLRTAPRTLIGLVLGLLAIVTLGSLAASDSADDSPFGDQMLVWDLLDVAATSTIFALILGILVVTWEYRHGTITQTFLAAPRRERVVGAKLLVALVAGVVLAVLALAVAFAIGRIWLGDLAVEPGQWELAGRMLVAAALWAALGVGLGVLVQTQVGGIVISFIWFLIVEPLIGFRFDDLADYLPGAAIDRLLATGTVRGELGSEYDLTLWGAAALATAYAAGITGAGLISALRRDVT